MPQPLPAITVPDNTNTLNALRLGMQDRTAREQRETLQEAGGLAAAGNYAGARGALYKGGQFDEARSMSAEMRAIQSHAKSLSDAALAKKAQMQDAMARLVPLIDSQEKLDHAKAALKARGFDASSVTLDQLPFLHQQALSVKEQYDNEQKTRALNIQQQKADAAASKAGKPKALTEGQASSRSFLGMMEQAESNLSRVLGKDNLGETPLNSLEQSLQGEWSPDWLGRAALNKNERQYMQAAEQFVRAKLRKESGATIAPSEFAGEFKTYFPQPGDDARTRRNKAAARRQIIEGFRTMGNAVPDNAPSEGGNNLSDLSDDDILKELSR